MLGSFIFLLSVIIPQFANAQEDIPKINEKQKQALELFSNSQSQHQQTSANDIPQNNLHSDKNILKKIIQQELQENLNEQEKQEQTIIDNQQQQINPIKAIENSKPVKEQGQEQQQQQQVKQRIQQQAESNNNQMETLPEVIIFEHADFGGEQQSIKGSDPNIHSWNDKISSVIVKSGTWQFYEHENYVSPSSKQVGPGYYEYVETPEFNIRNDNITAIKAISSSPQGDHLNSKPVKEQGQEQVTNNDKEVKALELFFNKGTQQQEIQQQSNEDKQQQGVKASTAATENSKPVKEQGQDIQQQQQVKQGIHQKADSNLKQAEPFMLFFNAQLKEQQQQYLKQQQLEQEKQKLQEILNEQEKQQQQPIQQQQTINQQQIEQEVQQKLEQEKQKLQEKLNEQRKQ
jgi:hypothetical protein